MLHLLLYFIIPIAIETYPTQNVQDFDNCRVKNSHRYELWSGKPIQFISFVSYEWEPFLEFTFLGKKEINVFDRLYLSSSGNKIHKARNGVPDEEELGSSLNATGWTDFHIKMLEGQIHIYTWSHLALNFTPDFPIHSILVFASNITLCQKNMASWAIEDDRETVVPLSTNYNSSKPLLEMKYDQSISITQPNEDTYYEFSFYSTAPFIPKISIGNTSVFIILVKGNVYFSSEDNGATLQRGLYDFHLQFNDEKVTMSHLLKGEVKGSKDLKVKNAPEYIVISTVYLEFAASLRLSVITDEGSLLRTEWSITVVILVVILSTVLLFVLVIVVTFSCIKYLRKNKYIKEKENDQVMDTLLKQDKTSANHQDDNIIKKGRFILTPNEEFNIRERAPSRRNLCDENDDKESEELRDCVPGLTKSNRRKILRADHNSPYETV